MDTSIIKIGTCWIWQISEINRLRKQLDGWFGYYSWKFSDECLADQILYIHIRPFLWKHILRHEKGHAAITRQCKTDNEAILENGYYDEYTFHGLLWWRNFL